MSYTVYQIELSKAIVNEVNQLGDHLKACDAFPSYNAYFQTRWGKWEPEFLAYYTLVAEINTDDLEEVFEVGNGYGDQSKLRRISPMHSVSVGDLVRNAKGEWFLCAPVGWELVKKEEVNAAA